MHKNNTIADVIHLQIPNIVNMSVSRLWTDDTVEQVQMNNNNVHPSWLPIKFRVHFKVLVLTYRALHCQAPGYISDLLHLYITSISFRSSDQSLLIVLRT